MANFLQTLVKCGRALPALFVPALLVMTAAAPAEAAFSHRAHLAKGYSCVVCHTAAPSSTKAADNLLPDPKLCAGCHTGEEGKAPKLATAPAVKQPRKPAVSKFNHQFHLKMGNIAPVIAKAIDAKTYLSDPGDTRKFLDAKNPCVACHRGLELSDAVTAAAYPRMADCLVCHNKIEPPYSCEQCHTGEVRLKPASHTADWVDVHSSGKLTDKTSCAVCHGRNFTCLGCH